MIAYVRESQSVCSWHVKNEEESNFKVKKIFLLALYSTRHGGKIFPKNYRSQAFSFLEKWQESFFITRVNSDFMVLD